MIQWSVFRSCRSVIRWILFQSGFDRSLIWKWICSKGTPQIKNPDPDSPKRTHPKAPFPWSTVFFVILDHKSKSRSSQRNAPLVYKMFKELRALLLISSPSGSCLRHARALWSFSSHVWTYAILSAFYKRNKLATLSLLAYRSTWELLRYLRRAIAGIRPWYQFSRVLKNTSVFICKINVALLRRAFSSLRKKRTNKTCNLDASKRGVVLV